MESAGVVGYVRVAPRERRSRRPDLETQLRLIESECERRGWRLVRVETDVRSGRTLRRHGLDAALRTCRAGEAGGIVVARLDRLTYSLEHLALLMREALAHRFNVIALDLGLDLSAPEGRHLATVLAAASEWHPRGLTRRAELALSEYRVSRAPGRPSSTPVDVAERIRSLRAAGWTLQAICDALNEEAVPTPRGGERWRPSSLRAILGARPDRPKEVAR
jgi:DNA invertase Pin-like site-specific DNA recombinase